MRKMTKTQANKLHDAQMMVFAMRDRVFAAVARDDVPFVACYAAATMETRMAYDKARDDLASMESALIDQGRGYLDACGSFRAYS